MLNFLQLLPKVELHAHLNGSLSIASLHELGEKLYGQNTTKFSQLCERFVKFDGDCNLNDCFEKFSFVHELTSTPEGLQYATELVIRDFSKDNVIYLELRTTPKSNKYMTRRQYLQFVVDTIKRAHLTYPIHVKLLISINRSEALVAAEESVALALEFSESHPGIIAGIDFSGNPHAGKFNTFVNVLSKARAAGLPLAIHCAEIDNPEEIQEMLDFGMSRCGHGTFLNSKNISYMQVHNIAIECCLTSNVKSGTVANFGDHHLLDLIKANAPKVLCTDDCGVFDTTLSKEFLIASENFGLSRSQCVDLTMEAVQHAFATPEERKQMQLKLETFLNE